MFLGQMRLWNPDEPCTPRGSDAPLSSSLEERLREACSERMISWNGSAGHAELLVLSEHLGLEVRPQLELLCLCRPTSVSSNRFLFFFPVKPGFVPESNRRGNHECWGVCFQGVKSR